MSKPSSLRCLHLLEQPSPNSDGWNRLPSQAPIPIQAPQQFFSGWALGVDNFTYAAKQSQQPVSWFTKLKHWLTGAPKQSASFQQAFTKSNNSSSGSSSPLFWLIGLATIGAVGFAGKHFDVWKKLGDFKRSKTPANSHSNPSASTLPTTKAGTAPGASVPDPAQEAFDKLKTTLKGDVGDAKTAIGQIAGHSNDQSLRKELLALPCQHDDAGVREEAIKQLHLLSNQKDIDELLKAALDKDNDSVRQLLTTAFLHPELSVANSGVKELSRLTDKDEFLQFFKNTLAKKPSHPNPLIQAALLHNEEDVAVAGIAELGHINNSTELNTFIQSILAKSPTHRTLTLQHCTGHSELEIVKTGIQGIINPGISDHNATTLLRNALANKPEDTFSILDLAVDHPDARVKNEGLEQLYATLQKNHTDPILQTFHNLDFAQKRNLLLQKFPTESNSSLAQLLAVNHPDNFTNIIDNLGAGINAVDRDIILAASKTTLSDAYFQRELQKASRLTTLAEKNAFLNKISKHNLTLDQRKNFNSIGVRAPRFSQHNTAQGKSGIIDYAIETSHLPFLKTVFDNLAPNEKATLITNELHLQQALNNPDILALLLKDVPNDAKASLLTMRSFGAADPIIVSGCFKLNSTQLKSMDILLESLTTQQIQTILDYRYQNASRVTKSIAGHMVTMAETSRQHGGYFGLPVLQEALNKARSNHGVYPITT